MQFEPAGVSHGIPAVGLPIRRYGGRIVGANGLWISRPCPSKLASERLVQTASGLLPVVGLDFRGPWQVGYASLARVSPAGLATLPDGTHVRVGDVSLDYSTDPILDPDAPAPAVVPSSLNATGAVPKVLVPTANDFGQILGPAGSNAPIGRAQIDTGLSAGEDFLADAARSASAVALHLPSLATVTTLLVCVLVAVGVWFLWPVLMAARRIA